MGDSIQAGYWEPRERVFYLHYKLEGADLIDTFLHEFAHCVIDSRESNPRRIARPAPHGVEWQSIMQMMGRSIERYGDYYWQVGRKNS